MRRSSCPETNGSGKTHKYLVRSSQVPPVWHELGTGARLASQPYVMPPGLGAPVQSIRFSLEMVHLPSGTVTPVYEFAFMVRSGLPAHSRVRWD